MQQLSRLLLILLGFAAAQATASQLSPRQLYADAQVAAETGNWRSFDRIRSQLDDYPLAIYLDYQRLDSRLRHVDANKANRFIAASEATPLQLRFKDRYLRRTGKDRRWSDYLAVTGTAPKTVDLQCYYYRALAQRNREAEAWDGARQLWVHGSSRPDACDPLFEAWMKAGAIDDEAVWQRQLLAFEARRQGLMQYASRQGSSVLKPWSEELLQVYRYPSRLGKLQLDPADPRSLDVAVYGAARLARVDPQRALREWKRLSSQHQFDSSRARVAGDAIAWRTLFDDVQANLSWVDAYLQTRGDTKLLETRLRLAIRHSDWQGLLRMASYLPEQRRTAAVWQYWRARALQETGQLVAAKEELANLAEERDYYGFLAAEQLGRPPQLNHQPLQVPARITAVDKLDAIERTGELVYHEAPQQARSEWNYLLERAGLPERAALAAHADNQGWHRFAIDAAIEAQQWNALEVRFPQPWPDTFRNYGKRYGVPDTELVSIARRESAFFSHARSGVGAKGLMQLMPATARSTARKLGEKTLASDLYQVEANIALGGAYYRQLLDQYRDNRVLSLAAYNAGPHRVKRWLRESGDSMDVYQWVETIPFRETRDYVQGVLAYNVVYDRLRNGSETVFRPQEQQIRY